MKSGVCSKQQVFQHPGIFIKRRFTAAIV